MLLNYERYETRLKRKKKLRIVFIIFLIACACVGIYFLFTRVLFPNSPFQFLSLQSPVEKLQAQWQELIQLEQNKPSNEKKDELEKKLLDDMLTVCQDILTTTPLDLRLLVYHGYASFYRALQESTFEASVRYFNQAVISLRRALLVANDEIKPQVFYMLGRAYFHKRNLYYDSAVRYLEKALDLGYKGIDIYDYLILVYDDWGNVEKSIQYLKEAYEDRKSDVYLFHLAKSYVKVNKADEATVLLKQVLGSANDIELLRECKFLLGEIYFNQRDFVKAEKLYREILKDDDGSAEAHFRLALIFEKTGDYAQYRYELRRTLEKDPGHSGARSRL